MGVGSSFAESGSSIYASSQEACDQCDSNVEASECSKCEATLCSSCCPHVHNTLFAATFAALKQEHIIHTTKGYKQLKSKLGLIVNKNNCFVFAEVFINDTNCKCCSLTSEWKLYRIGSNQKFGRVTRRMHEEDRTSTFPGDVCFLSAQKKTFFTLPCNKTVYEIVSYDTYREFIKTGGSCFGITGFNGGFAISVQIKLDIKTGSDWQVHLFDIKGNLTGQIFADKDGAFLFSEPRFLASNRNENVLFVSDYAKSAILAFDVSRNLLFAYSELHILTNPLGIDVDRQENVYVACGDCVVQIEKGGKTSRKLFSITHSNRVVDVCICRDSDDLLTIQESGQIATFRPQI